MTHAATCVVEGQGGAGEVPVAICPASTAVRLRLVTTGDSIMGEAKSHQAGSLVAGFADGYEARLIVSDRRVRMAEPLAAFRNAARWSEATVDG